ncbi:MAG: hypothetical protein ABFC77_00845 [Thermoguttaceae bacterium]
MLPESPESPPNSWNSLPDALAEIRGLSVATQAFATSLFDHLDGLSRQWIGRETERRQSQTAAEQDSLQQQIDRLASMIGQLSETLGDPNSRGKR